MITIASAKRELKAAGVAPHKAALAIRRLWALKAFWAAGVDAAGRNLTRTRQRIAAELTAKNPAFPVSEHSLEEWERYFRKRGVVALAGVPGGPKSGRKRREADLRELPLDELAKYAARVVGILATRVKRDGASGRLAQLPLKGRIAGRE